MKNNATPIQQRDTVMAVLLILLIAFFLTNERILLYILTGVLVLGMVFSKAFAVPARLWFGFSHLLGTFMSKVLMGVLFFLLVTPIGLLRRCFRKDALRRREWKKDDTSVFVKRDHTYTLQDIQNPY